MEKIFILGFAIYRISRFIVEDTLIKTTRDKVTGWFRREYNVAESRDWYRKLLSKIYDLITCPYCISVWLVLIGWNIYDRHSLIEGFFKVAAAAGITATIFDLRNDDIATAIKDN